MNGPRCNCDGTPRRDFLKLGLGGLFGLGLVDLLRGRASAQLLNPAARPHAVNCIFIWLDGGPSHYESFDPKPDAPSEIRGEFKPIRTAVPGIHFAEVIPKLASVADKFTVIRSVCHKDPNHGGGNHYMMTGAPTPVPVGCGAFVTFHPSFGSVVSWSRGVRNGMPSYMTMPEMSRSGGPNFLGARHAPFVVGGSPNSKSFRVRDVSLPPEITTGRELSRQHLRQSLDRLARSADTAAHDPAVGFDSHYQQALELVGSRPAQEAFDLSKEPDSVRDMYGRNDLAQRLLLARRLVEAGVGFVTCYSGGWDHHTNIFKSYKGSQLAALDQGLSALIIDLDRRGLLESTLVFCLGEFGRTPKVNKDGGRDHWPHAMSILAAGAGIPRGFVLGATDAKGYHASKDVHSPEDFAATLYTKMGIDPTQYLQAAAGRPVQLVSGGTPIPELFA
jgi:hypothetical protein